MPLFFRPCVLNTRTSQVERICTTEGQRERKTFSYKNKRNENETTTTTRKKSGRIRNSSSNGLINKTQLQFSPLIWMISFSSFFFYSYFLSFYSEFYYRSQLLLLLLLSATIAQYHPAIQQLFKRTGQIAYGIKKKESRWMIEEPAERKRNQNRMPPSSSSTFFHFFFFFCTFIFILGCCFFNIFHARVRE